MNPDLNLDLMKIFRNITFTRTNVIFVHVINKMSHLSFYFMKKFMMEDMNTVLYVIIM